MKNASIQIPYKFKKIFLHRDARNDEITRRVLDYYAHLPVEEVAHEDAFLERVHDVPLTEGKRYLWLTRYKGDFIKYCPGATNTSQTYRCCNYLVINEATNCPIECSYCFLQGYVTNPAMTIYTNYERIQEELRNLSAANPARILRVGTGELTDSLALDPILRLSEKLAATVAELPNILLEMKTKTDHVDHLLEMPYRKLVISWSVNPDWIVHHVEHKAATLEQRLQAMKKINDAGFFIGLHFDPIIYYHQWKEGYAELIDRLREVVSPDRIVWISMGSFRTPPPLKENIRLRFPKTPILAGEQIKGRDGKMRYIKPLRQQMYRFIYERLRQAFGEVYVYFCMESRDLWEMVMGKSPRNSGEVDYYFACSIYQKFPEWNWPRPEYAVYQEDITTQQANRIQVLWKAPEAASSEMAGNP
ncbi:MAG: hypothetical protein GXO78_10455 [Calditrichaeota bacterium]|nr:hypothetical protein [Calditrichota bacterium]